MLYPFDSVDLVVKSGHGRVVDPANPNPEWLVRAVARREALDLIAREHRETDADLVARLRDEQAGFLRRLRVALGRA